MAREVFSEEIGSKRKLENVALLVGGTGELVINDWEKTGALCLFATRLVRGEKRLREMGLLSLKMRGLRENLIPVYSILIR